MTPKYHLEVLAMNLKTFTSLLLLLTASVLFVMHSSAAGNIHTEEGKCSKSTFIDPLFYNLLLLPEEMKCSLLEEVISPVKQQLIQYTELLHKVPRRIWNGHSKEIISMATCPGKKIVASGSCDGTIQIWDEVTGEKIKTLPCPTENVNALAFSNLNGTMLISGICNHPYGFNDSTKQPHNHAIELYDLKTGQLVRRLIGHTDCILSIAVHPSGNLLASASADRTIKLWDLESGKLLHTLVEHQKAVSSLSFDCDGKQLASGSHDQTIKIWDLNTQKCINTLTEHTKPVTCVAFHPTKKSVLASGSFDNTIHLWNLESGTSTSLIGHSNTVSSLAFHPTKELLASGSHDSTIRLWDLETRSFIKALEGFEDTVSTLLFSTSGKKLISGYSDHTIKLWDIDHKENQTAVKMLRRSYHTLDSPTMMLLYVISKLREQPDGVAETTPLNLSEIETGLKSKYERTHRCSSGNEFIKKHGAYIPPLLNIKQSYDNLPSELKQLVKEYFYVAE